MVECLSHFQHRPRKLHPKISFGKSKTINFMIIFYDYFNLCSIIVFRQIRCSMFILGVSDVVCDFNKSSWQSLFSLFFAPLFMPFLCLHNIHFRFFPMIEIQSFSFVIHSILGILNWRKCFFLFCFVSRLVAFRLIQLILIETWNKYIFCIRYMFVLSRPAACMHMIHQIMGGKKSFLLVFGIRYHWPVTFLLSFWDYNQILDFRAFAWGNVKK